MKRIRGYLRLIIFLPLLLPAHSFALELSSGVMIVEVQTTGLNNNTSEEFVEIFNTSDQVINVSSWKLQYLSAGGTTWQTKTTLNGYLAPQGRMLLASSGYLSDIADVTFGSGFKLEAGHVRIVSPDTHDDSLLVVEDLVGWGSALYSESEPADYALAGQSLVRKTNTDNQYIDTDNNKLDFETSITPTPLSDNQIPEDYEEQPSEDPSVEEAIEDLPVEEDLEEEITEELIETEAYIDQPDLNPVQITELLPNPAPPATDDADEYIELYNPNNEPIDLTDYKLQTGNAFSYSFSFENKAIEPYSYLVLFVDETGLTLANTSGKARLLNSSGAIIFETDPYEDAKDGEAWSLINGVWQWNIQPTAGTANVLVAPAVAATTTKPKTPTTKTTKKKTPKTSSKKVAKKTDAKKKTDENVAGAVDGSDLDGEDATAPINKWIIAGIGVIAIGYALYEYKDDIRNKFLQLRRNRTIGKSAGEPT